MHEARFAAEEVRIAALYLEKDVVPDHNSFLVVCFQGCRDITNDEFYAEIQFQLPKDIN